MMQQNMLKSRFIIGGLVLMLSLSACGIFKKDCGCPKFGKVKASVQTRNRV